uniref:RNA polymerase beta' subunit n=1 Tax=Trentepohlia sp. BN17 TaxID=3063876 RepID=UPI001EDD4EA3|nr:RNA polymerase beta' subunit [Trentepohlia sp. BN17]UIB38702.1 RNA polymerase beta' subunit [Trentepohlia sp. BN17]
MTIRFLKLSLASPESIRSWTERTLSNGQKVGKILKGDLIDYKNGLPIRDGLNCERIFGPVVSFTCSCGRFKCFETRGIHIIHDYGFTTRFDNKEKSNAISIKNYQNQALSESFRNGVELQNSKLESGRSSVNKSPSKARTKNNLNMVHEKNWPLTKKFSYCPNCEVEILPNSIRRYRLGYIEFTYPVTHIWYLSSYIPLLLNLSRNFIEGITECHESFSPGFPPLSAWSHNDLEPVSWSFQNWMIISLLPVLPPDLRPIIANPRGYITGDINLHYQNIVYRNTMVERLSNVFWIPKKLVSLKEIQFFLYSNSLLKQGKIKKEIFHHLLSNFLNLQQLNDSKPLQEMQYALQKAVTALIDNSQKMQSNILLCLSDQLKGKEGRFRQHLLGKRVDYSARSVIVVGPTLKLYECGIPIIMALKLFQPFLIIYLINRFKIASLLATQLIQQKHPIVMNILKKFIETWPILLNRAPTLHRMNIQSFKIKLVQGKAILLHPLVCSSFNADFDGDQMGVHVPITQQARAEAWKLLWSVNNSIGLASRQPLFLPTQDMVIGNFYLT